METNEIIKVLETLIGKIEPVADGAIDRQRSENFEKYLEVFNHMHSEIEDIAWKYRNSPYGSAKSIGERADKFLTQLYTDKL